MPKVQVRFDGRVLLVAVAAVLLAAQMLFISLEFDAYSILRDKELRGWQLPFAHIGIVSKLVVVFAVVYFLIRRRHPQPAASIVLARVSARRFFACLPLQLLCFVALLAVTATIFAEPERASQVPWLVYLEWVALAALVVVFWLLSLLPLDVVADYVRRERKLIALALLLTALTMGLALGSQLLWSGLPRLTFAVSGLLLSGYDGSILTIDPQAQLLGLGDFVVFIAPACSGYEGIGLVTAFTLLYLYLHRQQFVFPRVLLLLPVGAVFIWSLNTIRIAALILIGYHWSPDVAVGGFHSHAGWITFVAASVAMLVLAEKSRLFHRQTVGAPQRNALVFSGAAGQVAAGTALPAMPATPAMNVPMAMLIPFVVLMAATLLTSAFSPGFDYLYPLKVIAVACAIAGVWRVLAPWNLRLRAEPLLCGGAVALLWVALGSPSSDANTQFIEGLSVLPMWLAVPWMICRLLGSVITVPIAEELAFRGYLLGKLSRVEPAPEGRMPFVPLAVLVSSLAFGALHGSWGVGIVSALVFAFVRLRSGGVGDVIVSHAAANLLLFAYAVGTGEWWVI